jgi:hypothetical protein
MTAAARYYRARLAKAGPFVAVKVWYGQPVIDGEEVDRSPRWQALVDTETTGRAVLMFGENDVPVEVDGVTLRALEPTTESEWRFLVADSQHAKQYRPNDPKASPRRAVDFANLTPF